MKFLKVSLCWFALLMAYTYQSPTQARIGDRTGNGGSEDEISNSLSEITYLDFTEQIVTFYNQNPRAKDTFPQIDPDTFEQVTSELTFELSHKELFDKNNMKRSCLNFPDEVKIICNPIDKEKHENDTRVTFILLFHEILGLMGIEESTPENERVIQNYEVSRRLIKYFSKTQTYKLNSSDREKKSFDARVVEYWDGNRVHLPACRVRELSLHDVGILAIDEQEQLIRKLRELGYDFFNSKNTDGNVLQGKGGYYSFMDRSLKSGIEIKIGVGQQYSKRFGNELISHQELDLVYIQELPSNEEIRIVLLDKADSEFTFFRHVEKKGKIEWALKYLPKCSVNR